MKIRVLLFLIVSAASTELQAQWVKTNGPYGGTINCAAAIGAHIVVGTNHDVFVSSNNGDSWIQAKGISGNLVRAFAVSASNLIASTTSNSKYAIFYSVDSGANWTQVLSGSGYASIAASDTNVFASYSWGSEGGSSHSGVFLSSNSGEAWTEVRSWVSSSSPDTTSLGPLTTLGTYLFGIRFGISFSADHGATWTTVNSGLTARYIQMLMSIGSSLFADSDSGLFISRDSAKSWSYANEGLGSLRVYSIAEIGANMLASTEKGIYESSDNGLSWTAFSDLPQIRVNGIVAIDTILVAATASGAYRSSDAGLHWTDGNNGITGLKASAFTAKDDLFVGTSDGIFHSPDSGDHWIATNSNYLIHNVTSMAVVGSTIVAGTNPYGMFRSTNSGEDWETADSGLDNFYVTCLISVDSMLFAGTSHTTMGGPTGVYRSRDAGLTWSNVDSSIPRNVSPSLFYRDGSGMLAFLRGTDPQNGTLFRSTDDGESWITLSRDISSQYQFSTVVHIGASLYGVDPQHCGLLISSDHGLHWTSTSPKKCFLSLVARDTCLLAGTQFNGVLRSTDRGETWNSASSGLPGNTTVNILIADKKNIYANTPKGIFRSVDTGLSWTSVGSGLPTTKVTSIASNDSLLFVGTNGSGVFVSSDEGISWNAVGDGLGNDTIKLLAADGRTVLAQTKRGLYFSTNNGVNWQSADFPLDSNIYATPHYATTLFVDGSVWLVGNNGAYRTTDYGKNWTVVSTSLPQAAAITALASDNVNIFVGTSAGFQIYRSTNTSESWYETSSGLFGYPPTALAIKDMQIFDATNGSGIFVAGLDNLAWMQITTGLSGATLAVGKNLIFAAIPGKGVYQYDDADRVWNPVNDGLADSDIYSLFVTDHDIYAGTQFGVVWKRPLSQLIPSSVAEAKFWHNALLCYPNPTTASTSISFAPETSGYAEILIVNMLGQEVARVYSGVLDASENRFTWDTGKMPVLRGVYQCVVRMNGRVQTMPIVVQ